MSPQSCRACLVLGVLVSALVHALALTLLLDRQPPILGEAQETRLELDLARFATTGDGEPSAEAMSAQSPTSPALAPSVPEPEAPPSRSETSMAGPTEPDPEPEPAPTIIAARPRPPLSIPKTPLAQPKPKAKPEPVAKLKPPKSKSKAKPVATLKPPEPIAETTEKPPSRPSAAPAMSTRARLATAPEPKGGQVASRDRANVEGAYLAELQRAIKRHQRYPEQARRAGREGRTSLTFVLLADGRFDEIKVSRSSGDRDLDRAAIDTLDRLGRFRPIPLEIGRGRWPLTISIRFDLR